MVTNSNVKFGIDPRVQVQYGQAKNLLHEKKALQKRLREIDKDLRELRTVAVAATDCALHDLAYEASASALTFKEEFSTLHRAMHPRALEYAA